MFINVAVVGGNMVADPEVREVGETSVARGRIISERQYVSKGEKCKEITGIQFEAWGKNAEIIGKYVQKGKFIVVKGRIKEDRWETKEGEKRSKLIIVVDDGPSGVQLGSSPKRENNEAGESTSAENKEEQTNEEAPF